MHLKVGAKAALLTRATMRKGQKKMLRSIASARRVEEDER